MSLKKKTNNQFVYLSYVRESHQDFKRFKRELENIANTVVSSKDVVIDFTGSNEISSSEIGIMVRVLNKFQHTPRFLRIVGNERILKTLESTNIHNLDNLSLYQDQKSFFDELKRIITS